MNLELDIEKESLRYPSATVFWFKPKALDQEQFRLIQPEFFPEEPIPIDGTCVRIGSLRCHSQAFTIKLKKSVDLKSIEELIAESTPWSEVIPNEKELTLSQLTPEEISGTMRVPVGRIRKMSMGDNYLNAFSIGDQLLWGAAEPLRRTLRIML